LWLKLDFRPGDVYANNGTKLHDLIDYKISMALMALEPKASETLPVNPQIEIEQNDDEDQ